VAAPASLAASGGAQLLKLRAKGLPVGADTGAADEVSFGVHFGHILQ